MKVIWKFQLAVADKQQLWMPRGAQMLTVQAQFDMACLWALCDSDAPPEYRTVAIYGTGHKMGNERLQYMSTFQLQGGSLFFHAFEVLPEICSV